MGCRTNPNLGKAFVPLKTNHCKVHDGKTVQPSGLEALSHPPPRTQNITKSWGLQDGHLSVVTPKLGPISAIGSTSLWRPLELLIRPICVHRGLLICPRSDLALNVDLLGLPYQSTTNKESQATQMHWLAAFRAGNLGSVYQQDSFLLTSMQRSHSIPFLVVANSLVLLSIDVWPFLPLSLQDIFLTTSISKSPITYDNPATKDFF